MADAVDVPIRDYSESIHPAFGPTLRALREERGLSQEELGFESGVHRTYVGELERGGKSPTISMLAKLARPLGLRPSQLLQATEARADSRRR